MDPASSIPRPSGLPRPAPSRLPVLRSSGSQSALRTPASTEQLRKKPSISSLSRPAPSTASTLQKKTSRASLVRSNTPSTAAAAAPTASNPNRASVIASRRVSGIPSLSAPRTAPSTTANDAPVFKRPYARSPSRQTKVSTPSIALSSSSREDDGLGSLDGFRSASRASSRASSRGGFLEDQDLEPDCVVNDEPGLDADQQKKKKSRQSLSERTIESLSQLPLSPATSKGRRRSSFFNPDNNVPLSIRSASGMSNGSRPTTSDGPSEPIPATPKRLGLPSKRLSMTVPNSRSVSAGVQTPAATPSRISSISRPASTIKKQPSYSTLSSQNTPKPQLPVGSKSMTARTPKPRPSLSGVFGQAVSPPNPNAAEDLTPSHIPNLPVRTTPATSRKVTNSSAALREHIAKAKASRQSDIGSTTADSPPPKASNSSNALREQIAKAREAARRAKVDPTRTISPPRDPIVPDPAEIATFDFGLEDPFNQRAKGGKSLLRKRIDSARVDGRLNVAAMGLAEIPDDILNMYKYDANDTTVAWGEIVDLNVMILADNEFETLPDTMFPDVDFEAMEDSDEVGPQFGAVHTIDLHGNLLRELPMGLARLTQLSKLNLSRNKLSMQTLDMIGSISTLRELKLAENGLQGALPVALCNLASLEVLELQANQLSALPNEMGRLMQLRTLNVSENQLDMIPSEVFDLTSLVELQASKNRLTKSLLSTTSVSHLQELHVANNSLVSLTSGDSIEFPNLRILNVSTNRLTTLPDVSAWTSLSSLLVGENKLKALPEGFTMLKSLRMVDFTGNDITQLDNRIALMESLQDFTIAANPLRERKFLTMNTEDIKRDLASRLQPVDDPVLEGDDVVEDVLAADAVQPNPWQPNRLGTLDCSNKSMKELDEAGLEPVANSVYQLYLQQNTFEVIPSTLTLLTHLTLLDLSKNAIQIPLQATLELPKLRELRLSSNKIRSLEPITSNLSAPALQILDVSRNAISGALPALRSHFPELITLIAGDNSITEVSAESLTGLKIVNLCNNDIERLEPRIGLLQGTLTSFEVEGNKFRVPNYQLLSKGTDATLSWLKDKIPRESWKSDGTEFFDADDGTTY